MTRLADALALVFTPGVSIDTWAQTGMLARELALYERLRHHYARVLLITWGDQKDTALAHEACPWATVLALGEGTAPSSAASAATEALKDARSILVKTNQLAAGDHAIAIVERLRAGGARASLLARGGYPYARFAEFEHGADSEAARAALRAEARLAAAADLVVGTTPFMASDIAARLDLPAAKTRVVPNYVAMVAIDEPPHPHKDPPKDPPARDAGSILFAGRLVPQKRVDLMIEAVAHLPTRLRTGVTLDIVGEGPLESGLRTLAQERSAPVRFFPRTPHDQLVERMRRCAVYAQTSAYEGHPKTVLEAMAAACPVLVAADAPGLTGVVEHETTGLVAEPTAGAIAAAIERLHGDPQLRARLGDSAQRHALERFSLDRVLPLELEAHRAALAAAAKPSRVVEVRWPRALLDEPEETQLRAWRDSLHGFQKRLPPRRRAKLLMGLDDPLYQMQGRAAVESEGDLHPKHRLMRYHDFFVGRIKEGERVLDLGCGPGALACAIAGRAGAVVTGMDWSSDSLDAARKRAEEAGLNGSAVFIEGDITKDPAPQGADAVVLSNVLEHLKDRPQLLRWYNERHTPSRFLIRVPAFDRDWRVPWKKELGVEWRLDPTHELEYTQERLEEELAEAGLAIDELERKWGELYAVAQPA